MRDVSGSVEKPKIDTAETSLGGDFHLSFDTGLDKSSGTKSSGTKSNDKSGGKDTYKTSIGNDFNLGFYTGLNKSPSFGGSGGKDTYETSIGNNFRLGFNTGLNKDTKSNAKVVAVLESGKGYVVLKYSDGSVIKRIGVWSLRNNNPGNIQYGSRAKKYGAIGAGGRFAVFPDLETGYAAVGKLLRDLPKFYNNNIYGAIKYYAPKEDHNDPKAYADQVVKESKIDPNKLIKNYTDKEMDRVVKAMTHIEGQNKSVKNIVLKGTDVASNQSSSTGIKIIERPKDAAESDPGAKIVEKLFGGVGKGINKGLEKVSPSTVIGAMIGGPFGAIVGGALHNAGVDDAYTTGIGGMTNEINKFASGQSFPSSGYTDKPSKVANAGGSKRDPKEKSEKSTAFNFGQSTRSPSFASSNGSKLANVSDNIPSGALKLVGGTIQQSGLFQNASFLDELPIPFTPLTPFGPFTPFTDGTVGGAVDSGTNVANSLLNKSWIYYAVFGIVGLGLIVIGSAHAVTGSGGKTVLNIGKGLLV